MYKDHHRYNFRAIVKYKERQGSRTRKSMSSTWFLLASYDSKWIKRIKVTTALWVSPSQVFRQTVQLCRLCWPAPDPGAQRSAQKPRQLLEHILHTEPPEVRCWKEVQHLLGAGQRSVQQHTTCCLVSSHLTDCSLLKKLRFWFFFTSSTEELPNLIYSFQISLLLLVGRSKASENIYVSFYYFHLLLTQYFVHFIYSYFCKPVPQIVQSVYLAKVFIAFEQSHLQPQSSIYYNKILFDTATKSKHIYFGHRKHREECVFIWWNQGWHNVRK